MTEHLPECIYAPRNVDPKKGIEWGGQPCICYALRACEQRALARAREAIAWVQDMDEALDVMDALRDWNEPPPLPPSQGVPTTPMWPLRKEKP